MSLYKLITYDKPRQNIIQTALTALRHWNPILQLLFVLFAKEALLFWPFWSTWNLCYITFWICAMHYIICFDRHIYGFIDVSVILVELQTAELQICTQGSWLISCHYWKESKWPPEKAIKTISKSADPPDTDNIFTFNFRSKVWNYRMWIWRVLLLQLHIDLNDGQILMATQ